MHSISYQVGTNLILDALAVSTGYKIKTFCPSENHFYSMFFVSERTLRLNSTYNTWLFTRVTFNVRKGAFCYKATDLI